MTKIDVRSALIGGGISNCTGIMSIDVPRLQSLCRVVGLEAPTQAELVELIGELAKLSRIGIERANKVSDDEFDEIYGKDDTDLLTEDQKKLRKGDIPP